MVKPKGPGEQKVQGKRIHIYRDLGEIKISLKKALSKLSEVKRKIG